MPTRHSKRLIAARDKGNKPDENTLLPVRTGRGQHGHQHGHGSEEENCRQLTLAVSRSLARNNTQQPPFYDQYDWLAVSQTFMDLLDHIASTAQILNKCISDCYQNPLLGRTLAGKLCGRNEMMGEGVWEDVLVGWIYLKLGLVGEAIQLTTIGRKIIKLSQERRDIRERVCHLCAMLGRHMVDSLIAAGKLCHLKQVIDSNHQLPYAPFKKAVYFSILFGYDIDDHFSRIKGDATAPATSDVAAISRYLISIDEAIKIRDGGAPALSTADVERRRKKSYISLVELDLLTDAMRRSGVACSVGRKDLLDAAVSPSRGNNKRKAVVTLENLITKGPGSCLCGHTTCPKCSSSTGNDGNPKGGKKRRERRITDWTRDNLYPGSVCFEDMKSYTDAALPAPVDLRAASIAYPMVVELLNKQQTTLDGIVFPGDSDNAVGKALRGALGLSGRPIDSEVMKITITALMSKEAENMLLELREKKGRLRVNAVIVMLIENVLSFDLKELILDHKDELPVVYDDRHSDGIRAAVRLEKGLPGEPKTPLVPTGKRCVQAVAASDVEKLSFDLETKLLNWFIDETNHWVYIITGLMEPKTELEKAVRQAELERPGGGVHTEESVAEFLVPRVNINQLIGKYGTSSSYGIHKDTDKMLTSPSNKIIHNQDGATMPKPKHMMVSTNALGRDDYKSKTAVEWIRKKKKQWVPLGELSTNSNCKHIQGIYANEYEIYHKSFTKVEAHRCQDGSKLFRSRILDTYRQTLTPMGGPDQEMQYLERLVEEGRYKQKETKVFHHYSHYKASQGTPVIAPTDKEISAHMWWREAVQQHMARQRDPDGTPKKELKKFIQPKKYLPLKKQLLAGFSRVGPQLSLPAKTIGITRGHKWDHYRHHMLAERAIEMRQIVVLADVPSEVSSTVLYTYENRAVPPGMPFSNYESPSQETDYKREVLDPATPHLAHIREKYRNPFAPVKAHHDFFTELRKFVMGEKEEEKPVSVVKPGSTKTLRLAKKELADLEEQFYALPTIIVGGSGGSTNKSGTYGFSASSARSDDPHVSTGNAQECHNKVNKALMEIYERQSPLALFLDNKYFDDKREGHVMLSYYRVKGFTTTRYQSKRRRGRRKYWRGEFLEQQESKNSYVDFLRRIDDGQGYLTKKDNHSNLSFLFFGALDFELEQAFDFQTLLDLYKNWMMPSNPYTQLVISCSDPKPIRVPLEGVIEMLLDGMHDADRRFLKEETAKFAEADDLERAVLEFVQKKENDSQDRERLSILKVLSRGVRETDKASITMQLKTHTDLADICSDVKRGRFPTNGEFPESWVSREDIFEYICSRDDSVFLRLLRIDDAYEGDWAGKYRFGIDEILPITVAMMGAVAARANQKCSSLTKEDLKVETLEEEDGLEETKDDQEMLEAGDGIGKDGDRYITPPIVEGSDRLPMPILLRPPPCPNRDLDIATVYYREQVARRVVLMAAEQEKEGRTVQLQRFLHYNSYREPDTTVEGNLWLLWDLLFRAIILRAYGNIIWQEAFYGWAQTKHDLDPSKVVGIPGPNVGEMERFIDFLDDGCIIKGNNSVRHYVSKQHDGEVNANLKGDKFACFKYLRDFCGTYITEQQSIFDALKYKKEGRREKLVHTLARLMNDVTRDDDLFICNQAVADLEGIFIEFAGDVTLESVFVGSGGGNGAAMIDLNGVNNFARKDSVEKVAAVYTLHKDVLLDDKNEKHREALLYEIATDGVLRSILTGRPFSILDTEHVCCKVYIAVTCSHSSRFAETPTFYKAYCWPPPGDPDWAREASVMLQRSWSVITTKLPKDYMERTYPSRLSFEPHAK